MKKLVILTPPYALTADQVRQVTDELARWRARGNDAETLVLSDGWKREVVEGDAVEIALVRDCLREDDPRLPPPKERAAEESGG